MTKYAYSPDTGELIRTATPSEWMGITEVGPPVHDPATAGCFWRGTAWEIVVASGPTHAELAATTLAEARRVRLPIISILDGMQASALTVGNTAKAQVIETAKQGLKNITLTDLSGCATAKQMKAAILLAYVAVAAALPADAQLAFSQIAPAV